MKLSPLALSMKPSPLALLLLVAAAGTSTGVSSGSEARDPFSDDASPARSLAVVQNVYLEAGVTIRHLGRLRSASAPDRDALDEVLRTAPRALMNFSAAVGARDEDLVFAYSVALEAAIVGYEGLVYDPERVFNLEDAWHDVFHRPEALTLKISPDKPRLDPANAARVLVNWGRDWPKHEGWRGWHCDTCSASAGSQGASGGLRGSGRTWEYWGRIITVLQRSAHAYYHFVAECLPKLLLVSTEIAEYPDAVLIVDQSFGSAAWTEELMTLLGIEASRLVVRVPGKVYLADTVHLMKPTPVHRAHSQLLRIMTSKLMHAIDAPPAARQQAEADTILLVMRTAKNNQHSLQYDACKGAGGCKVREVVNMGQLKDELQRAFPQLQVRLFDSASMPILRDQIKLFSQAVAVVGAHGAGLTNAIFAPRGAVVLELLPQLLQRASVTMIFWHLAVSVGHGHATYVVPHELMVGDNATALHNFRVPPGDIAQHLHAMLQFSPLLAHRLHLLA